MLANAHSAFRGYGALATDLHKPGAFLNELIDFVEGELPHWRDREDRPQSESETLLTSQLCSHLNGVSRRTPGWDILQFKVEEPDGTHQGRRIDLVAQPSGVTITIEGRRHTEFDTLIPIECKRLPTPSSPRRDEREYVFSQYSTTGGIQRFKVGLHGSTHSLGIMIGYVQSETTSFWVARCQDWIKGLIGRQEGWDESDLLALDKDDVANRLASLHSLHVRAGSPSIQLRHLWIGMK